MVSCRFWINAALSAGAILLGSGCFLLPPKPVLPRHVGNEPRPETNAPDRWLEAALVADVIYCASDRPDANRAAAFARKVVAEFGRKGTPFQLGWATIDCEEQPTLDALRQPSANVVDGVNQTFAADEKMGALGDLLREARERSLVQAALGCPADLPAKWRTGQALTPAERRLVPRSFNPPPGALEDFAESAAGHPTRQTEEETTRLYRASVLPDEVTAALILKTLAERPDDKLLVIIRAAQLGPRGVPYYVAQKTQARQVVLDERGATVPTHAPLLTLARGAVGDWSFQVVNGAPTTGSYPSGRAFPRPPAAGVVSLFTFAPEKVARLELTRDLFPVSGASH